MNGIYILLIIIFYFSVLLLVSYLTGKNSGNAAFFQGNRKSPWYIVSFGMIGTSISGVTFVSVPGIVGSIDMTYMQTCFGFFFGYIIIAKLLLPLYYKLNLISIYTYLGDRIGRRSYKTGSSFFLISKIIGAAARLYLVCLILQEFVFTQFSIPFPITVTIIVLLIWLYTRRSGIKTIVWTDSLQTLCLLLALGLILFQVSTKMNLGTMDMINVIRDSDHSKIFVFDDWHSKQNFFKQFFSGIFITIVMTGLEQDMMQKNLSCKDLKSAQKNMYCYVISFLPVNFLFLSLGILLRIFVATMISCSKRSVDMNFIRNPVRWTSYLGESISIPKALEKGQALLKTFTNTMDFQTQNIIRQLVPGSERNNIFSVTRWIFINYSTLTSKDEGLQNKRIRLSEYLISPFIKIFTEKIYRFKNTPDKLKSMKNLMDIFKIKSSLILNAIIGKISHDDTGLSIAKFSNECNDDALINTLLYVTKSGPGSPSEHSKRISMHLRQFRVDYF